jgi:hypothetical protein
MLTRNRDFVQPIVPAHNLVALAGPIGSPPVKPETDGSFLCDFPKHVGRIILTMRRIKPYHNAIIRSPMEREDQHSLAERLKGLRHGIPSGTPLSRRESKLRIATAQRF